MKSLGFQAHEASCSRSLVLSRELANIKKSLKHELLFSSEVEKLHSFIHEYFFTQFPVISPKNSQTFVGMSVCLSVPITKDECLGHGDSEQVEDFFGFEAFSAPRRLIALSLAPRCLVTFSAFCLSLRACLAVLRNMILRTTSSCKQSFFRGHCFFWVFLRTSLQISLSETCTAPRNPNQVSWKSRKSSS
jgi:hypothetical protein